MRTDQSGQEKDYKDHEEKANTHEEMSPATRTVLRTGYSAATLCLFLLALYECSRGHSQNAFAHTIWGIGTALYAHAPSNRRLIIAFSLIGLGLLLYQEKMLEPLKTYITLTPY